MAESNSLNLSSLLPSLYYSWFQYSCFILETFATFALFITKPRTTSKFFLHEKGFSFAKNFCEVGLGEKKEVYVDVWQSLNPRLVRQKDIMITVEKPWWDQKLLDEFMEFF